MVQPFIYTFFAQELGPIVPVERLAIETSNFESPTSTEACNSTTEVRGIAPSVERTDHDT